MGSAAEGFAMTRAEEAIAAALKAHELTLEARAHPERAAEFEAAGDVYRAHIREALDGIAGRQTFLRRLMDKGDH
jgi:hypothetical protein